MFSRCCTLDIYPLTRPVPIKAFCMNGLPLFLPLPEDKHKNYPPSRIPSFTHSLRLRLSMRL